MLIYISYSSRDRKLAESLANQLGKMGHAVHLEAKRPGGETTWGEVFERVKDAELFILALTPQSLRSASERIEYSYAAALQKRMMIVMLSPVDLRLLPVELSELMVIDFQEQSDIAVQSLANALARLPPSTILDPLPSPPNLSLTLNNLREQVDLLPPQYKAQNAIMLNLQEFLERRETFDEAKVLLNRLAAHEATEPEITQHIKQLLGVSSKAEARNSPLRQIVRRIGELGVILLVVIVLLILGRSLLTTRPATSTIVTATNTAVVIAASATNAVTATVETATATQTDVPQPITATPLPTQIGVSPTAAATSIPLTETATLPSTPNQTPSAVSRTQMYVGMWVEDTTQGVHITQVRESAHAAGVRIGDYVVDVDQNAVTDRNDFLQKMAAYRPLAQVIMRLRRSGQFVTARIKLGVADFAFATAAP